MRTGPISNIFEANSLDSSQDMDGLLSPVSTHMVISRFKVSETMPLHLPKIWFHMDFMALAPMTSFSLEQAPIQQPRSSSIVYTPQTRETTAVPKMVRGQVIEEMETQKDIFKKRPSRRSKRGGRRQHRGKKETQGLDPNDESRMNRIILPQVVSALSDKTPECMLPEFNLLSGALAGSVNPGVTVVLDDNVTENGIQEAGVTTKRRRSRKRNRKRGWVDKSPRI